jgi:hypothetical protein
MRQQAHQGIKFFIRHAAEETPTEIVIDSAVIAGWTGRDAAAVERHITELEAVGVKRPSTVPIFYRVSASRLTTATAIEVPGDESSGEIEFVLIQHRGTLYVGCGSDHTDRKVEGYSVTISKQMCEKPIAPTLWPFEDVKKHWDRLILRSYVLEAGSRTLYQEGPVTTMRDPSELIARYTDGQYLSEGTAMFCGTLAAKGGIRPATRFEFELEDEVRGLRIQHGYDIAVLPVLG